MASVADAFADDLEQIRQVRAYSTKQTEFTILNLLYPPSSPVHLMPVLKEPNMTKSRLAILIDSLASGGEVFSSYARENGGLNEMDIVLNSNHDV